MSNNLLLDARRLQFINQESNHKLRFILLLTCYFLSNLFILFTETLFFVNIRRISLLLNKLR